MSAASAITRRALGDSRTRNVGFAYLFAATAYIQPVAYRHSYATRAERLGFAHSFGNDKALRLFYGRPYDLLTIGGYSAWRVAGILSIFAAIWGFLAAVRALRAEEEAGRTELVLAGIVGRRDAFVAVLAAVGGGAAMLWLATFAALTVARLPASGAAYLALATVSAAPVFAGVGALASQLAPTGRVAIEFASAALVLALIARVLADTSSGLDWLRWTTPLGWAEELRPFAGPRPLVLLAPAAASAAMLALAGLIAVRRDVGTGLLPARDRAKPSLPLLSSPTAQALRDERAGLAGWLLGIGGFAFLLGIISNTISSNGIPKNLQQQFEKFGTGSILTPSGYLGFTFLFFVLAVSLFCCQQLTATRHEEAEERLETLLALPVGRCPWFAGRLALASTAAAVLALAAGALAWVGASSQGVAISLPRMLEAGANCLPAALLFLGLGALAFAVVPRASSGISYGLVGVAFLWDLFGALLGAPRWLLDLTPFQHVGLVPAQPFRAGAAAVMLAIAAAAAIAALWAFRQRDLSTA